MEEHKVLSRSEISLHTSKKDCWLIINGKVYDVTEYLEEHPGGEDTLLEAAAYGDATNAFEEVGHSAAATSTMTSFLIGIVEGSDGQKISEAKEGFVAVKPRKEEKPSVAVKPRKEEKPSALMSFLDFLVPLLIVGLAFGAWYYYNKGKA